MMFLAVCLALLAGYPVAFTLGGVALWFAVIGIGFGVFDAHLLLALPDRLFGIISNTSLIAVPLFVFMGVMLERSKLAEDLLGAMAETCGRLPGGLGVSVVLVGALLAASTGIVGATVVTMGLISLPTMLKQNYPASFASGIVCATGTLGQIIPPSIALVLLGDVLASAYQQAQLAQGIFNPTPISVGDLFVGAIVPGILLVGMYIAFLTVVGFTRKGQTYSTATSDAPDRNLWLAIAPPALLILLVLGSIISGAATPTEAAGIGAVAATVLAVAKGQLSWRKLTDITRDTTKITTMVFTILVGASIFSLVFLGLNGEELIHRFFQQLPGGAATAIFVVMAVIFLLGFILDFIEITFVVVPIVGPVLLGMGVDPLWLGVMIALNLQTSFLTPPFGFALFYLRGVAPDTVSTQAIYRGVVPFIALQLLLLVALALWPGLVTWLPKLLAN